VWLTNRPLVVGTRAVVAPSVQKRIRENAVFVRFIPRSPREAAHRARLAHVGATIADTSELRSWPVPVASTLPVPSCFSELIPV
jgi:hypothetical protein